MCPGKQLLSILWPKVVVFRQSPFTDITYASVGKGFRQGVILTTAAIYYVHRYFIICLYGLSDFGFCFIFMPALLYVCVNYASHQGYYGRHSSMDGELIPLKTTTLAELQVWDFTNVLSLKIISTIITIATIISLKYMRKKSKTK